MFGLTLSVKLACVFKYRFFLACCFISVEDHFIVVDNYAFYVFDAAISLFHKKITVSVTKSLHQDCAPYAIYTFYFSYKYSLLFSCKIKVVVITIQLCILQVC